MLGKILFVILDLTILIAGALLIGGFIGSAVGDPAIAMALSVGAGLLWGFGTQSVARIAYDALFE